MRILVTGIDGFVGRHLAHLLDERGYDVAGLDLHTMSCFRCDLGDGAAVAQAVKKIRPDAVIHLAAISRVDFNQPDAIYRVNVTGTLNLLQAVAGLPVIPPFLLISSSQVYGNPPSEEQPVRENCRVLPVNHYGASKASAESIARAFSSEHAMPLVIARPFNHTGAGQTTDFVIPKIVKAFRERKDSLDLGNIDTIRDFLDVRDVCNAYSLIMDNFHDGEVYNIASGKGTRIRDVITMCEQMTGHHMIINCSNTLLRRNEISSSLGSSEHLVNQLSWKIQYNFDETIRWMLEG